MKQLHQRNKPILVTGLNRSGTTWAGHMIASSPTIGYIHEPFNLSCHPGICNAPFKYWFSYVSQEIEAPYRPAIQKTLNFRYNYVAGLKAIKSKEAFVLFLKTLKNTIRKSKLKLRPLMKDPVAIFSVEWLASRFDMDVVIIVRHPAAYVSSLKRLSWFTKFSDFLSQPLLMRDCLSEFQGEIESIAGKPQNIVDNAILSWKIMFSTLLNYQKRHSDWLFLRHEDLSLDPVSGFKEIYHKLGLDFTDDIVKQIEKHSNANVSNDNRHPFDIHRNSKANIHIWKSRLSNQEISKIRDQLGELSSQIYSDSDW